MNFDLAVKAHFDNKFNATFKKVKEINGGILELPENVMKKKPEIKYIYEINDDSINIYVGGTKEKTIKCPKYGCRPLIAMDILFKMISYGLTSYLLIAINDNGEELINDEKIHTKTSANLLDEPDNKKQQILENELYNALGKFFENQSLELVTPKIEEAFNIVMKNYVGSLNED